MYEQPTPSATASAATLILGRGGGALRGLFPGRVDVRETGAVPAALVRVGCLVLADGACPRQEAMRALELADRAGAALWVHAAILPVLAQAGVRPCRLGTIPFYCFADLRRRRVWLAERLSPLVALLALPLALPALALLALRVWLTDGRPVVFAQSRVGRRGRRFTIFKFRTMRAGGEEASRRRVTGAGERLRRHGLDELPQVFNLLLGSMAWIGPRPLPVDEHPAGNGADAWMKVREQVLPGLTGLYQICPGRRELGLAEMCILDAYWLHNRSPRLNAWIVMRTAVAMFRGWGRDAGKF